MLLDWGGAEFARKEGQFWFSLKDPDTGDHWINTKNRALIYEKEFFQIGFMIKSHDVFGFGEKIHDFGLDNGNYTSWTRN